MLAVSKYRTLESLLSAVRADRAVHLPVDLNLGGQPIDRAYSVNLLQHRPLVHGDVIGLIALDLELRFLFTGMVHISFVLRVACVDLDYPARDIASLGIPANMIADFEALAHVAPLKRSLIKSDK